MSEENKQYGWKDLTISYGGRVIDGVTGFSKTKKAEKTFLRGRGLEPYEILTGNKEYEGKLTLWLSEALAMERDAPDGDILNLVFDLTEAYIPEDGGQTLVRTHLKMQVTEFTEEMKQGDTHSEIELPVMYLGTKTHDN